MRRSAGCIPHSPGSFSQLGDAGDLRRIFEGLHQDAAVHIFADGQAEEREDSGRDIEERGAVNSFVLLDVIALHADYAELAVLHGRAGGFHGDATRTQMVGMEAVVGDHDDGGVGTGEIEQRLQHHVVKAVGAVDHVFVNLELGFGNAFHARRMVVHEAVAEVVDAVVVDGEKIPGFVLQDPGGGVVDGTVFGKNFGERLQAFIFFLIDLCGAGNPGKDGGFAYFGGMHAQLGEFVALLFGMNRAGRQGPRLIEWGYGVGKKIGNGNAVDRSAGWPANQPRTWVL